MKIDLFIKGTGKSIHALNLLFYVNYDVYDINDLRLNICIYDFIHIFFIQ